MTYQSKYGPRNKGTQILEYSLLALGKWFQGSESLSSFVNGEQHGDAVLRKRVFGSNISMCKSEECTGTSPTPEAVPTEKRAMGVWRSVKPNIMT